MFGNLGLSPATLAGLSNVSGVPVDDYDAAFAADQAEQAQFAAQNGLPPVQPLAPPPKTDDGMVTYTDPSAASKATGQQSVILSNGPLGTPPQEAAKAAAPLPRQDIPANEPAASPLMSQYQPTQTIPAHWQPGMHEVDVQRGMNPDALMPSMAARGEGFRAADASAEQKYIAAQLSHAADVDAGRSAAVQMAAAKEELRALDARRKAYIADEHAKLEALNAQANKKVDTDEAFVGGSLGRIGAALAMGLGQFAAMWKGGSNAAMQIVNDAINHTIEQQKANAQIARGAFADRRDLYRENMLAFGEDRAALATKIQLLDKVAQLADQRRAQAGALVNEATYNDTQAAIAKERGATLEDFAAKTESKWSEKMNESFKPAAVIGGGASVKREGNLVTLPDGSTFVMPSEKTADKALEKIQTLDTLQRRNNDILQLRDKAAKLDPIVDYKEYNSTMARLKELADEKVALMSLGLGQGTVKEDEYKRAQEFAANATNGLGFFKGNPYAEAQRAAATEVLRAQNEKWAKDMRSYVTAAGGAAYNRDYTVDQSGQLKPSGSYAGKDATPTEHLAPNGSKALDGKSRIPTPGPKTVDLIPPAPVRGYRPVVSPPRKGR